MAKTYNWGIIGLGHIAHKFAQDLLITKNARLHAVASRSLEKATAFAELYHVPHYFGSYEEMVKCPDIDVIYIATPHTFHCEHTLLCLKHQIPVLCEKPFAMNAREVESMIALAKAQDTFLMEALWTRFLPTIRKTLELIDNGTIGKVLTLKADFGYKAIFDPKNRIFNHQLGGGSLLDVGIYPIFLSLLLFGKPTSIKAVTSIGQTNVDETCGILLQYPGHKMAILHSSIIADTGTEAIICGERGNIKINTRWHEPTSLTLNLKNKEPQDFFFNYRGNGYEYEIQELMKCLDRGMLESLKMSHDFSLDLIELLDAIRIEAGIYYPKFDYFVRSPKLEDVIKFSNN